MFLRCLLVLVLLWEPWARWDVERKRPMSKYPDDDSTQGFSKQKSPLRARNFYSWFGFILSHAISIACNNQSLNTKVVQALPHLSLFCQLHHGGPFPRRFSLISPITPAIDGGIRCPDACSNTLKSQDSCHHEAASRLPTTPMGKG